MIVRKEAKEREIIGSNRLIGQQAQINHPPSPFSLFAKTNSERLVPSHHLII
jgi:hypothetical protein